MSSAADAMPIVGRSVLVARVHGAEVRVDPSFFLGIVLLVWSVVTGIRRTHPTWTVVASGTFTVLALTLFFVSLLLHEVARAIAAQSLSLRVRRVTLFVLGGAAELERPAETPTAEALVAIAGPLVSLVTGVACTVFASFAITRVTLGEAGLQALADVSPFSMLALWLAAVNLGLGLVNLVPAVPLDGGTVLQAILWRVTGEREHSVQIACFVGRVVGWAVVAMGFLTMLTALRPERFEATAHALGGLWLGFLGLFVALRARARAMARDSQPGSLPQDQESEGEIDHEEGSGVHRRDAGAGRGARQRP